MVGKRICPPVFHSIEPQVQIRTEMQEARGIPVGHKMRCCWVVPCDAGRNPQRTGSYHKCGLLTFMTKYPEIGRAERVSSGPFREI